MLDALTPIEGETFIDGTFGAGGYSRALLERGAARVIAIDRDPDAISGGAAMEREFPRRFTLMTGTFGSLDTLARGAGAGTVDGVVLDVGVSSMQIDQAGRGFSFMRDGPLDMRMSACGASAGDIVNRVDESTLADLLFQLGEERASRRIARAICSARHEIPITRTTQLAAVVAACLPKQRPDQIHPATRTFQALRIAVNDELGQIARALGAAERVLHAGGRLAVVTFHSLEDRIVKRFLQIASGRAGRGSRHQPEREAATPRFEGVAKPVTPSEREVAHNPRARSARLRAGVRTSAPAVALDPLVLGVPRVAVAGDVLGQVGR